MAKITIDKERCKGCLLCIEFCPKGLIKPAAKLNKRGARPVEYIDPQGVCLGCSQCAIICPDCCIEVFK